MATEFYGYLEIGVRKNYKRWIQRNVLKNPVLLENQDYFRHRTEFHRGDPKRKPREYALTLEVTRGLCIAVGTVKSAKLREHLMKTRESLIKNL